MRAGRQPSHTDVPDAAPSAHSIMEEADVVTLQKAGRSTVRRNTCGCCGVVNGPWACRSRDKSVERRTALQAGDAKSTSSLAQVHDLGCQLP
jgi:hypothetical protein